MPSRRVPGRLYDRRGDSWALFDQPVSFIAKMPYGRGKGSGRTVADLRTAERGRGRRPACAGQDARRFHHMGEGAIEWHLDRQSGTRHYATSLGSSVRGADRPQRRPCAIPWRGTNHSGDVGGDVNFAIDNLASYISQIEAGTMRALAVTSAQRWPTLPNVPTMAEVGVPDFIVTSWAAYVMPIATAPAIVDKLATAQKEIAAEASTQNRAGARLFSSTPGRGRSSRRQGHGYVVRGGAPLRFDAAVTIPSRWGVKSSSTPRLKFVDLAWRFRSPRHLRGRVIPVAIEETRDRRRHAPRRP